MTLTEAIQHYNSAVGYEAVDSDENLGFCSIKCIEAVYDIQRTAELVTNQGGTLSSRQIIATLIVAAERRNQY